eukprot:scaffold103004_cov48-Phaeocystis_antarctica.AAC.1
MDYSGPFVFHRLPEVRDCPRRAKHTAPWPAHPHSLPKDSAPLIARAEPCVACACRGRTCSSRTCTSPRATASRCTSCSRCCTLARASPRMPQPPPCAAPQALTTVGCAPLAAPTSSRWPRSSPRKRGRLARRCEAGPGQGSLPLSAPRARVQAAHPARLSLPVQVDAEEWAQVPEDQPIADISVVNTVRAASTDPHAASALHRP